MRDKEFGNQKIRLEVLGNQETFTFMIYALRFTIFLVFGVNQRPSAVKEVEKTKPILNGSNERKCL